MTRYVSPDFLPFLVKKTVLLGRKRAKQLVPLPPLKKTVEIGERRDRGCLFSRMIEMICKKGGTDVSTLCKLSTLKLKLCVPPPSVHCELSLA
jgi:hypothetical protein